MTEKTETKACMTQEELNKLPLPEQRVEIAKDVLDLLRSQAIFANKGSYMESQLPWSKFREYDEDGDLVELDADKSEMLFRDFFRIHAKLPEPAKKFPVGVCAIGAMFIGAVDKFNSLQCADLGYADASDDDMVDYLDGWFEEFDLRLIETAFERQWCGGDELQLDEDGEYRSEINDAADFCAAEESAEERMQKIMQNIIDNQGEFRP